MWASGFLMQYFTQVRICIYYPFSTRLFEYYSQLFTRTVCEIKFNIVDNVFDWLLGSITFHSKVPNCTVMIITSSEDCKNIGITFSFNSFSQV